MSRRKKSSGSGLSGNEWLQTYSDTVTLLLTFFILLYSFSSVNSTKLKQISVAMQSVLQGTSGDSIFDNSMGNGNVPLVGDNEGTDVKQDLYDQVKKIITKNKLESKVQIKKDPKGVNIELRDNVLFESAQADIKESSKGILDKLAGIIAGVPYNIVVEGHTDNVPINNYRYQSNWELSTDRAVNVVKYFIEEKKLTPARFTAAGYGEYKPLVPNNSDKNRAHNRRVNILIVANEKETENK